MADPNKADQSINQPSVTSIQTASAALKTQEEKKRHISQVSATPKKPQSNKRANRKRSDNSETHSNSDFSDVEELNSGDSDQEQQQQQQQVEMSASNTQQAPPTGSKDLPTCKVDEETFRQIFLKLMTTDEYQEQLSIVANKKLETLQEDVQTLKTQLEVKDAQIAELRTNEQIIEDRLDAIEQKLRLKNIRISGEEEQEDKEDVMKTALKILNKIECKISPRDIENVYRIGKKKENTTRPILVEFATLRTKRYAYKARTKLKSKYRAGVWMSEDLTPQRSNTMYHSRRLMKAKLINDYWSSDGELFIKEQKDGDGKRLISCESLNAYIPDGSLIPKPKRLTMLLHETVPQDIPDAAQEMEQDQVEEAAQSNEAPAPNGATGGN